MQNNQWILEEAAYAKEHGIAIDVEGISYEDKSQTELLKVLEHGSYMLDYEGDALGRIIALHVDRVGPSEKPSYKSLRCTKK
ncbi:MAG: hypothetical protein J1F22_01245 [Lachnospiraceae bacterium]|nr:hypothetical protein [Lachnospiraceae bacterium]